MERDNRDNRMDFTGNKQNCITTRDGKLTKFCGHEGINENHESIYLQKFLAVRYENSAATISGYSLPNFIIWISNTPVLCTSNDELSNSLLYVTLTAKLQMYTVIS